MGKQTLEGHLKALEAAVAEGQQEIAHRLQKLGLQLQLLQEGAAALAQVDMVSTAGCHGQVTCYVHLCTMQCEPERPLRWLFCGCSAVRLGPTQLPALLHLFPNRTARETTPSHGLQDASQLRKVVAKKADRGGS